MPNQPKRSDVLAALAQLQHEARSAPLVLALADDAEVAQILAQLGAVPPEDVRRKLALAGVTDRAPGPDQARCLECMYFLVHRRWCDVPELGLPVEPTWWCRLWRS